MEWAGSLQAIHLFIGFGAGGWVDYRFLKVLQVLIYYTILCRQYIPEFPSNFNC